MDSFPLAISDKVCYLHNYMSYIDLRLLRSYRANRQYEGENCRNLLQIFNLFYAEHITLEN